MEQVGQNRNQDAGADRSMMPGYFYKPSPMGSPWQFRLDPDHLVWMIGRKSGSVRYDRIGHIRLSFRPATMQTYRFLAEIWPVGGPKLTLASSSWRGLIQQERLDRPYRDFLIALHQRIALAGGKAVLQAGSPPAFYWPGLVLFGAMVLGFGALLLRAIQQGSWPVTFLIAGFFVSLLWQIGGMLRRNYPRRYALDAIPEDLLPKP
jgi:hypothetical protein